MEERVNKRHTYSHYQIFEECFQILGGTLTGNTFKTPYQD